MSIFKGSFRPYLQKQLTLRQDRVSNRDNEFLTWLNTRTCFIRLSSSVNIDDPNLAKYLGVKTGNHLAKLHVLEGGELSFDEEKNTFSSRYGLGDKIGAYGDKTNATRTLERGLVPMSGIISASINSKSAYGTLQQATVKIRCNSLKELERIELLYCRVGYTVLLEYGWTTFINNNGKYITDYKNYNILDSTNLSKEQIFSDIYGNTTGAKSQKLIENSSGNYDALYGYVLNYSWQNVADQDNSFDVTVEILTIGEIIESLKMNYVSKFDLDSFTSLDAKQKVSIEKDANKSKINAILSILKEYSSNNLKLQNVGFNKLTYQTINIERLGNINFLSGYVGIKSQNNQQSFKTYIRFGDFIDILNKNVVLSTDKGTPFVKLSLNDKSGGDNLCFAHYLQIPTDLDICYIESCKNSDLLRFRLNLSDDSTLNDTNTYFVDNKYNRAYIKNIYLNLDFLISAVNDSKVDDNVTLNNYLLYILKNINDSLGNINDFKVICDHESDLIRIIDGSYTEGRDDKQKFVLELSGLKSTVRGYSINSMIYPNQSNMIAISAGVNSNGSTGVNTNLFDLFNRGLSDRIIKQRMEPNKEQNTTEDIAKSKSTNLLLTMRDYVVELNNAKQLNLHSTSSEINKSLKELIALEMKLQLDDGNLTHSTAGILPIKLNVTMDGIAGLRIGDVFKIPDNMLPVGYKGFGKTNRVGFIITRLSHGLSNNDWITTVETQTVILDETGSFEPVKYAKVLTYNQFLIHMKGLPPTNIYN